MVFRKITIDNSVRYVPTSEKKTETDIIPKKRKPVHFLVNKTKNFQKLIKNLLKISRQKDLEYLIE